uniref:Ribonuclease H-like domain-containing protein n=1 Tax=Tanacetum cinerariifolium TaxID=118510 RepID=A0A6L2J5X9_TANCI|nr:ribonuclease H-like domain-containing protein [Tanacetum cinerariifolium]
MSSSSSSSNSNRRSYTKEEIVAMTQCKCDVPNPIYQQVAWTLKIRVEDSKRVPNMRKEKGVSTEDANQKFLRSLPSSWSQVSLIMRTKPGVDTLSFDDLYNNLRVFKSDVKGSTASSSST